MRRRIVDPAIRAFNRQYRENQRLLARYLNEEYETSISFNFNPVLFAEFRYIVRPRANLQGYINQLRTEITERFNDTFGQDNIPLSIPDVNNYFIQKMNEDGFPVPPEVINNINLENDFDFGFRLLGLTNYEETEQQYLFNHYAEDFTANYEGQTERYFEYLLIFLSFKLVNDNAYNFPLNNNESFKYFIIILRTTIIREYVKFFYRDPNRRTYYGEEPQAFEDVMDFLRNNEERQFYFQEFEQNREVMGNMFPGIRGVFHILEFNNLYLYKFLLCFENIKLLNYYNFLSINLKQFTEINRFLKSNFNVTFPEEELADEDYDLNNYFKVPTENVHLPRPYISLNQTINNIEKHSRVNNYINNSSLEDNFIFNNDEDRNRYIEIYNFIREQFINEEIYDVDNNRLLHEGHKLKYYRAYDRILKNVAYDLAIYDVNYSFYYGNPEENLLQDDNFTHHIKSCFPLWYLIFSISNSQEDINIYNTFFNYYQFLTNLEIDNKPRINNSFRFGIGLYFGLIYYCYGVYGKLPDSYLELSLENLVEKINVNNLRNTITKFTLQLDSTNEINIPYYNLDIQNNPYVIHYTDKRNITSIFPSLNRFIARLNSTDDLDFYNNLFNNFDIPLNPNWHYYKKIKQDATCYLFDQQIINNISEIRIVNRIRQILQGNVDNLGVQKFMFLIKILYIIYQFTKDNFGCQNIFIDMRVFSQLNRIIGIKKETFLIKNIPIYGTINYNPSEVSMNSKFIKITNITEVESYIISLKTALNNHLQFYIIIYNKTNGNENNKWFIPINRLSTHFLSTAFLDGGGIDETEVTYEYYNRVKANSRLFYAFGLKSIAGIQLDMNCFVTETRPEIFGEYLPIKLTTYNVELTKFAYFCQIFNPGEKADQQYNCFYWTIHITNYYGSIKNLFTSFELAEIYYKYGKGVITLEKIKQFHNEYKINIIIKKIKYLLGGATIIGKDKYKLFNKEYKREIIFGHILYETYNHFFPIIPINITQICCKKLNLAKQEYYNVYSLSGIEVKDREIISTKGIRRVYDEEHNYKANTYQLFKGLLRQDMTEFVSAYEMEEFLCNTENVEPNINMIIKFPEAQSKKIDIEEDKDIRETKKKPKFINFIIRI